ncbi:FGGY carbohydrate kinase domain-containing protein-like isoform X1 [Quercus lobata]|uniref:FGGY carbohydrate kinase domain-containing protein-like isoform X1 n=1 Tax=Quercus lobata TaxID=97700 RepID=UPI00124819C6|nr:FGGY carbohydrate kinase domain-containing protein-like isoform X1 [Quercus lobata]XP_030955084.1 FGGY carbohydrate kinase domain-containing protein-like isoform X1 [Quercus lobata]
MSHTIFLAFAGIHFETSLIDAHAGGVGVMESVPHLDSEARECDMEAICYHMVLVCGTSTCHMAISRSKLFIPGVRVPFWSGCLIIVPPGNKFVLLGAAILGSWCSFCKEVLKSE